MDKRIDKYGMVGEVMRLYDEIDALSHELLEARRDVEALLAGEGVDGEGLCAIDVAMLAAGRRATFEKHTYRWQSVSVSRDEETGRVVADSFERFCQGFVNGVPDFMSKDEFLEYFYDELMHEYEVRKAKAIKEMEVEEDA